LFFFLSHRIYSVEGAVFKSYTVGGGSGKLSSKEHALNNMAAGSFCG